MFRLILVAAVCYVCWQTYQASEDPPEQRPESFESFLDWR